MNAICGTRSAVSISFAWGIFGSLISIMFLGTTFGYFGLAENTAAITVIAFRVAKEKIDYPDMVLERNLVHAESLDHD